MPVSQDLLDILVCPETKQPVSPASDELLRQINQRIEAGSLRNRGGDTVSDSIQEGSSFLCRLLVNDLVFFYP